MLLLVGLGNPGSEYAGNRHNVGFMAVDTIVRRHRLSATRKRFQGETHDGVVSGEKVLVLKPQTFMNESGRSVGEAARFFKLTPSDIIVFYDEIDLAPGKLRIKTGGGAAGHNGIRSIDAHLGDQGYRRVRIGVGHPGQRDRVHGHVLGNFAKSDRQWLETELDAIAACLPLLIEGRNNDFTSQVSQTVSPKSVEPKTLPAAGKNASQQARVAEDRPQQGEKTNQTALGSALNRAMSKFRGGTE